MHCRPLQHRPPLLLRGMRTALVMTVPVRTGALQLRLCSAGRRAPLLPPAHPPVAAQGNRLLPGSNTGSSHHKRSPPRPGAWLGGRLPLPAPQNAAAEKPQAAPAPPAPPAAALAPAPGGQLWLFLAAAWIRREPPRWHLTCHRPPPRMRLRRHTRRRRKPPAALPRPGRWRAGHPPAAARRLPPCCRVRPTPSRGRPLFSPSSNWHALHTACSGRRRSIGRCPFHGLAGRMAQHAQHAMHCSAGPAAAL
jgi:hypothetical protein